MFCPIFCLIDLVVSSGFCISVAGRIKVQFIVSESVLGKMAAVLVFSGSYTTCSCAESTVFDVF